MSVADTEVLRSEVKLARDALENKRRFRDSEDALKIQPLDEAVERAEQTVAHTEAKLEAAGE
jgi:hypothetical protein